MLSRFSQQDVRAGTNLDINIQPPGFEQIRCEQPLRIIQGKRIVCRGSMGVKTVLVKIFFNDRKAKKSWQNSLSGAKAFLDKGLPAPEIIYSGPLEDKGKFIIVFNFISNAKRLDTALEQTDDQQKKIDLKHRFMDCLAAHHTQGVVQNDQHLGNFLVAESKIYAVDGDQIQTFPRPVPLNYALKNLAAFFRCFPPQEDQEMDYYLSHYLRARNLAFRQKFLDKMQKHIDLQRKKRLKEYLRKIYRNRDPFVAQKSSQRFCIYDQRRWHQDFIPVKDNPEAFFPESDSMAQGEVVLSSQKRRVILKREKFRFRLHFWKKSNLEDLWEQRLIDNRLGQKTARPILLVKIKTGMLYKNIYLLIEKQ